MLAALKKKRSRYELGDKPFVLAIPNVHAFAGSDDLASALFGEEAMRLLGEAADGQLVMEPNPPPQAVAHARRPYTARYIHDARPLAAKRANAMFPGLYSRGGCWRCTDAGGRSCRLPHLKKASDGTNTLVWLVVRRSILAGAPLGRRVLGSRFPCHSPCA